MNRQVRPVSAAYRRYALWLLLTIYIFNFLDRQIMNILAEPIKQSLGLKDWHLGLLTGLAFAAFYTVLGIPIARLAERHNRAVIISSALAVWSAMTALCGLAQSYLQLLLARIGVGIGEAGCTPPAHSLITDYTSREQRASALAFYSMGIPLGTLAGMVFGGLIADRFGWRAALLVAGIPGLLLAILARLTLREVREPAAGAGGKGDGADLWQSLRTLWGKHCFRWAVIGATLTAFISYGQAAFVASFFLRNHGETVAVAAAALQSSWGITLGPVGLVGVGLGLVIGLAGVAGTAAGGALTDRLAVRDQTAYMTVPAWAALLGVVAFLGMLFTSALWLAALWCCATMFLKYMWSGPVFAVVQTVAPPDSRATASAVLLFVVNIVGLGLGPLAVGVASDLLAPQFGSGAGLRLAMAGSASAGLLSAAAFWIARRTVVAEMGA